MTIRLKGKAMFLRVDLEAPLGRNVIEGCSDSGKANNELFLGMCAVLCPCPVIWFNTYKYFALAILLPC